jgi:Ni/Co efflux regulator RcnB
VLTATYSTISPVPSNRAGRKRKKKKKRERNKNRNHYELQKTTKDRSEVDKIKLPGAIVDDNSWSRGGVHGHNKA